MAMQNAGMRLADHRMTASHLMARIALQTRRVRLDAQIMINWHSHQGVRMVMQTSRRRLAG
jgi:hypothetical protein